MNHKSVLWRLGERSRKLSLTTNTKEEQKMWSGEEERYLKGEQYVQEVLAFFNLNVKIMSPTFKLSSSPKTEKMVLVRKNMVRSFNSGISKFKFYIS